MRKQITFILFLILVLIVFLLAPCAYAQPGDPGGDPDSVKTEIDTTKHLSPVIANLKRGKAKVFYKSKMFLFATISIVGIIYAKREDEE